ncbi:hypothetical protein PM082_002171 [Marasmius tenuissimus]|nr:hypothetical protein PM082_002171 [Marasmius tenuissimus]
MISWNVPPELEVTAGQKRATKVSATVMDERWATVPSSRHIKSLKGKASKRKIPPELHELDPEHLPKSLQYITKIVWGTSFRGKSPKAKRGGKQSPFSPWVLAVEEISNVIGWAMQGDPIDRLRPKAKEPYK